MIDSVTASLPQIRFSETAYQGQDSTQLETNTGNQGTDSSLGSSIFEGFDFSIFSEFDGTRESAMEILYSMASEIASVLGFNNGAASEEANSESYQEGYDTQIHMISSSDYSGEQSNNEQSSDQGNDSGSDDGTADEGNSSNDDDD